MVVDEQPRDPLADWAGSGAMWLTGRVDGPPGLVSGTPATAVRAGLAQLESAAAAVGADPSGLPDHRLLGERAALANLSRNGRTSAGGATRLLDAADGVVALSLARPSDIELLPALTQSVADGEPWEVLTHWVARTTTAEIIERTSLLGIACGCLPAAGPAAGPAASPVAGPISEHDVPVSSLRRRELVVVDLSALWAGPLCAHLLHLLGARVTGVESVHRPDLSRGSQSAFYDLLHAGTERCRIDFRTRDGIDDLRGLLGSADLVIESSRPRALQQLGIDAERLAADHGVTWLSITAYGRDDPRIGFGDDVAIAAGLAGTGPVFAGDAIADPLTGVHAALVGYTSALAGQVGVVEVAMRDVVAATAGQLPDAEVVDHDGAWYVDAGAELIPIARPGARTRR